MSEQEEMGGGARKCKRCSQPLPVTKGTGSNPCPHCRDINPPTQENPSWLKNIHLKLKNKFSGNNIGSHGSLNKVSSITTSGASRQKKRAVLCGVTYNKRWYKLKGTVNDVKSMKELLVDTFKFPEESIIVLTEQEPNPEFTPTKQSIEKALKWLVEDCQSGDSLVFYFSGHGLRQPDFNNDERDGFDETICPVDFRKEGMIIDNDLNSTIVRPLKEGVTLHAFVDACHSGTILDLMHVYAYDKKDRDKGKWIDNSPPSGANKSTSGGLAISFSACADNEMAADTTAFSGKEMAGAMTYCFINAIKNNPQITYGGILESMHDTFEQANQAGCFKIRILEKVFHNKLIQVPQLSSSQEFDVYSKKFKL